MSRGLTYAGAGVDIDAAEAAKKRIKSLARSTFNRQVLGDIGGFGGLFSLDMKRYKRPVLVSSVDGVGTKLKIAFMTGIHDTVGYDLVSHCVNDILVQGAEPLFFLDYIAMARMDPQVVERIVAGLARACREFGCALIGGETAQMPDFYRAGEYDLAGCIVGVVEKDKLIDGSRIRPGDVLVGLPSFGLHTNGYSLARKIFFEVLKLKADDYVPELGRTVAEELLAPHRCYLKALKPLIDKGRIKGLAHITGGGITDNLPRILPSGCQARIRAGSWPILPIFAYLQEAGGVSSEEMYRTFNMGIGMIIVAGKSDLPAIEAHLKRLKESYFIIGTVARGPRRVSFC